MSSNRAVLIEHKRLKRQKADWKRHFRSFQIKQGHLGSV